MSTFVPRIVIVASALCLLSIAAMAADDIGAPKDGREGERYAAPTDQVVGPSPANPQATRPETTPTQLLQQPAKPLTEALPDATTRDAPDTRQAPGRALAAALIGKPVKDNTGDEVGEVTAVAVTPAGRVDSVIVAVGGVFGLFRREVALHWGDVRETAGAESLTVAMTGSEMKDLPAYEFDRKEQRGTVFEKLPSNG